ncbi:hypothetical protein SAMN05216515_1378 [Eubacterium pyruvativorans]|uniref:Uncharacterized protein n=1 Tax=Eubacterium pyruvativorans TaxID=155865 RepID=A0A1I7I9Z6_9FIRM|nr:hypothetical protein [Eubacterium pyruvativorans]SFO38510.1 hypothetical protein SAMN05216515_1378 [Eubacterium pyruvativorans]SFU69646.1 hypothetical protein SAMN05216508_1366 [Eubacterium pyruvativorans]
MAKFSEKNYSSVNTVKDAAEKDWSLTGIFRKSIKQATVKLKSGKEFQYASRWPFKEGDVAIVGNTLLQSYIDIEQSPNSGLFGIITYAEPKLTIKRSHAVELDYVFTESATKKNITDCAKYLKSPLDFKTVQYEKFSDNYFPLSLYIRKLLAAASIIAHPKFVTADDIEAAKKYIGEKQDVSELGLLVGPPEEAGLNFTDTQINTRGKSEEYLQELGIKPDYYMGELTDLSREEYFKVIDKANIYVNKYIYMGAISIMVRGGFVNLLEAFLSAEPPIRDFNDEMIGYLEKTGNTEALDVLKTYSLQR